MRKLKKYQPRSVKEYRTIHLGFEKDDYLYNCIKVYAEFNSMKVTEFCKAVLSGYIKGDFN